MLINDCPVAIQLRPNGRDALCGPYPRRPALFEDAGGTTEPIVRFIVQLGLLRNVTVVEHDHRKLLSA